MIIYLLHFLSFPFLPIHFRFPFLLVRWLFICSFVSLFLSQNIRTLTHFTLLRLRLLKLSVVIILGYGNTKRHLMHSFPCLPLRVSLPMGSSKPIFLLWRLMLPTNVVNYYFLSLWSTSMRRSKISAVVIASEQV